MFAPRLADNWLALTVRFIVEDHQTREAKDAISRGILDAFGRNGIAVASQTFGVTALPTCASRIPPSRRR